jgi:hypothetical protein
MNALIRAATGRGAPITDEPPSIDEPKPELEAEPELTMNDLVRRAAGRSYEQSDEQPSETTKPRANQMFNDMIRADAHSGRQFSFGLPVSEPSSDETEETS